MVEGGNIKSRRRGFRWVRAGVLIVLIGTLGAAAGIYHNRLAVGQWGLGEVARYFDFSEIRFTLSRLETDGARLDDIRLGPDARIGSIEITYALSNVVKGRVERVTVTDMDVDISQPDQGFLGKLQQLANAEPDQTSPSTPQNLSSLTLRNSRIHGTLENAALDIALNADLNPDLSGDVTAKGAASYHLPDRRLAIRDLSISGQLEPGGTTAAITLKTADITDEAPVNWFPPMQVSGKGTYSGSVVEFSVQVDDRAKRFSSSVSGRADVTARSAKAKIVVPEITLSEDGLQPDDLSPLARLPIPVNGTIGGTADVSWQDGQPEVRSDIRLSGGGATLDTTSVKGLQARMTAKWPTQKKQAKITVHIPHAVVRHEGKPFRISSAAATARLDPLTGNSTFTLPILRLNHMTATPLFRPLRLRGIGDLKDKRVRFNLSAFLDKSGLAQALLNIDGNHRLDEGRGQAKLALPELTFEPDVFEPGNIAASLALPQKVAGRVSGQSDVAWSPSGVTTSGRATLSDLSITTDTLSVEGINTDLRLSSLWPPRTALPQTIRAARIASAVVLENPAVQFSIPETDKNKIPVLLIHNLSAGFIGGSVSIENMRADPDATTHQFTLDFNHLDLAQVFALMELDGVSGTGKVSGKIPLSITDDDIVITDGLLTADAPGVLRFRSTEAKQALAGGGEQVELLLQVLNDFRYDRLSLDVSRESSGSAHLGLHLGGHNPAVMNGHAFNLNINLQGNVDRLLKTLLEGYRLSDRALRATVGAKP